MTRAGRTRLTALAAAAALLTAGATACSGPPPSPEPGPLVVSRSVGGHVVHPDLARDVDAFFSGDFAQSFRDRRAVLVSVAGWTVLRRQYESPRGSRYPIQGIEGAVLATLVGIALDEGRLRSVEQTLGELLPAYRSDVPADLRSQTLRKVLSTPPDPALPPQRQPAYLLAAVLQSTGVSVARYAQERLFTPLTLRSPASGLAPGAAGLQLSASDLAKLGQLWLGRGVRRGQRIVSATWVTEMAEPQKPTYQALVPLFGYQLWLTRAGGHRAVVAAGAAGQLVEVVPDLDLVAVVQSAADGRADQPGQAGTAGPVQYVNFVSSVVVPAIE